jgi:VWFA-related protein
MDVSGSMRGRVRTAAASAERFFATVLTARDSASLLTFHHDIQLLVPFTSDVAELRYGTTGARAWGTTRLNDSLIYTLYAFGGLRDKRALVLLSDGQDVHSDYPFRQVLELALRSRVAIYPLALDLPDEGTRGELEQLADETGGRFFTITSVSELDQIYRQIEKDLRSQYLLVYRPPSDGERGFRAIRVDVGRDGLKAHTLRGYYP